MPAAGCPGIPADSADLRLSSPEVQPLVADAVVVHPGAAAPPAAGRLNASGPSPTGWPSAATRSWSPARWTRRARRRSWSAAADCAETAICGQLDVIQLAALVANARLVICGDTGVAHLASAYGTPSVLLFGPTPPSQWGPPADGPHTVLWHGLSGDPHGDRTDPGLLRIGVEDVMEAAARYLSTRPRQTTAAQSGRIVTF